MKRWTMALAVLLGGTLSVASADYVIIIYNLGGTKAKSTDGGDGRTGTGPTAPGGGAPGKGGGFFPQSPPGPGAGALGGRGPMVPGGPGGAGPGPGGGAIGPPGGGGSRPPMGALGGPRMPGMGGGPMMPGMGGYGPSGSFAGGYMGGSGTDSDGTPLYVKAVVEVNVDKRSGRLINNGKKGYVLHKWGRSCLMDRNSNFFAEVVHHDTVIKTFEDKKKLVEKGDKSDLVLVLQLADWALTHGLIAQYQDTMKKAEELDPKNAQVASFKQIDAEIKREAKEGDLSGKWKDKILGNYIVTPSEHYVLLHQNKSTEAEVRSRLNRLENQFKTFYYWFASQGQLLPVPQHRLVAVLVPDKDEFERQQKIFESTHLVDDGFFARRENLVVFSQMRIDTPYLALIEHDKPIWTGGTFERDESLKGVVPTRKLSKVEGAEDKLAEAHTMALLEKALEEDAARAAVSHDGTRQLIAASGLTVPGVAVPEWIQFGMGTFFETPKGAPWTSACAGHWDYLPAYKKLIEDKKLDKPSDALKGVVTDRYFRLAADPKKSKPEDNAELKARTLSWALTCYLARNKMDGLLRYYRELSKLPRDIEFDEEVLLGCFARAFDLLDPATNKLDENKLDQLATRWHDVLRRTPEEAEGFLKELKKNREEALQSKPEEKINPFNPPGGGGPNNP